MESGWPEDKPPPNSKTLLQPKPEDLDLMISERLNVREWTDLSASKRANLKENYKALPLSWTEMTEDQRVERARL